MGEHPAPGWVGVMSRTRFPRTLDEAFPASAYRWYYRDPRRRFGGVCWATVSIAACPALAWRAAQGV